MSQDKLKYSIANEESHTLCGMPLRNDKQKKFLGPSSVYIYSADGKFPIVCRSLALALDFQGLASAFDFLWFTVVRYLATL